MKYKKYAVILICSVVIYMALTYLYNYLVNKKSYITYYVATSDISKGEEFDYKKLQKVDVRNMPDNDLLVMGDNIENKVFISEIGKGELIKYSDLVNKSDFSDDGINYEYISIKLNGAEESVSYSIKKDSNVNIYYTAKTEHIKELITSHENVNDSIALGENGSYTTINLLNNIKVIDAFNKSGISTITNDVNSVDNLVDTITIKVTKDTAMRINNLKNYGTFSCTINE